MNWAHDFEAPRHSLVLFHQLIDDATKDDFETDCTDDELLFSISEIHLVAENFL